MNARRLLIPVLALLVALPQSSFAAEPQPSATPECTGLPGGGASIPGLKLFARPIEDPDLLRLSQRLIHASSSERKDLLKIGASSGGNLIRAQVDAAVRSLCLGELVTYSLSRTAVELGFVWDDVDDARLEKFVNGPLAVALGAEAARAALSPDALAAALHGFPAFAADAAATTAVPCSGTAAGWMIRDAKEPLYPHQALQAGEIGTIKIALAVDASGLVKSARVRVADVDLDPARGGGALVFAALISAGAVRLQSTRPDCMPAPGEFLYKVDFSRDGVRVGAA